MKFQKGIFLNFDWSDTTLSPDEQQEIKEILIEFHDNFARHRFDIGIIFEFKKVKLTPNDGRPAYSQSLPTPINLKDDITVRHHCPSTQVRYHQNLTIFQICQPNFCKTQTQRALQTPC